MIFLPMLTISSFILRVLLAKYTSMRLKQKEAKNNKIQVGRLMSSTNTVSAQEKRTVAPQIAQQDLSPGDEGTVMRFNSTDDEIGVADDGLPVRRSRQASGTIWTSTWYAGNDLKVVETAVATSDSNISKRFIKYLTGSWTKAEKYTWSKSNSASWSKSASTTAEVATAVRTSLGLSASRTTTYSISITIPASTSKYSKLGFASDYFRQNYKYTMTVGGEETQSHRGYIDTPTQNSYLIVYYQ